MQQQSRMNERTKNRSILCIKMTTFSCRDLFERDSKAVQLARMEMSHQFYQGSIDSCQDSGAYDSL